MALAVLLAVAIVVNTRSDSHISRIVVADKQAFHRWLKTHRQARRVRWMKVEQPLGTRLDQVCAGVVRPAGLRPRRARLCAHVARPSETVVNVWRLKPGTVLGPS